MKDTMRFLVLVMVALTLVPGQALAQALPSERATAHVVGHLTEPGRVHGLVVGFVTPQGRVAYGFGHRSENTRSKPPDDKTVFEIGSITKAFTGLLLAQAIMLGKVRVTDPIGPYLPPGTLSPNAPLARVSFLDLATHSSGLPSAPDNLPAKDPLNPMAGYSTGLLLQYLPTASLAFPVGRDFLYSNTGAGLCGYLLARQAKTDYETLVRQQIGDPLGLYDTRVTLSADMAGRMTHGHNASGQVVPNWAVAGLEGAGALRSTAEDMLTFAAANLGITPTPLLGPMKLSHMARKRLGTLPNQFIGLFWNVANYGDKEYVLHAGRSGGYFALILLSPADRAGIVLLSDTEGDYTSEGWRLLELLMGKDISRHGH
jgi:CubicO group peptidase (beta-lactamase class C family)